jgi:hypothetical protein
MAEFVTKEAQIIAISFIRNKSSVIQMTEQLIGANAPVTKSYLRNVYWGFAVLRLLLLPTS